MPRLGSVALVAALLGYSAAVVSAFGIDAVALAAPASGLDTSTTAMLIERYQAIPAVVAVALLSALMPIGTLLLGVALWVGRTVPRWAAAILVVGIIIVPVGAYAAPPAPMILGWVMVAVGYTAAGTAYARR